jgi:hypothetical protein
MKGCNISTFLQWLAQATTYRWTSYAHSCGLAGCRVCLNLCRQYSELSIPQVRHNSPYLLLKLVRGKMVVENSLYGMADYLS